MKAIVRHAYGSPDVLRLEDVEKPAVEDDGVLVRVRAASINALDWHIMRGAPLIARMGEGFRTPKTCGLGVDVAGEVEAVGKDVTDLRPGDAVFGRADGAFAEYVRGTPRSFVPKPATVSFEQAAAIAVAGCTALQGLRDRGELTPGQRVLINGAGRWGWHVRRPDRQGARRARDGSDEHAEPGVGPIDGRRPGDRLHAR
jgi:NADPH:quinone reductase-like Zn-dependent oxidoreductase